MTRRFQQLQTAQRKLRQSQERYWLLRAWCRHPFGLQTSARFLPWPLHWLDRLLLHRRAEYQGSWAYLRICRRSHHESQKASSSTPTFQADSHCASNLSTNRREQLARRSISWHLRSCVRFRPIDQVPTCTIDSHKSIHSGSMIGHERWSWSSFQRDRQKRIAIFREDSTYRDNLTGIREDWQTSLLVSPILWRRRWRGFHRFPRSASYSQPNIWEHLQNRQTWTAEAECSCWLIRWMRSWLDKRTPCLSKMNNRTMSSQFAHSSNP